MSIGEAIGAIFLLIMIWIWMGITDLQINKLEKRVEALEIATEL